MEPKKTTTLWDWVFFGAVPAGYLSLVVAAQLDPSNPTVGLAIGWISSLTYGVLGAYKLFTSLRFDASLRFVTSHGITVAWRNDAYAVRQVEVEKLTEETVAALETRYPNDRILRSVRGALVMFREPSWMADQRNVAGLQDGLFLQVGFNPDLRKTALKHELAHLIILRCEGNLGEGPEHAIMQSVGL